MMSLWNCDECSQVHVDSSKLNRALSIREAARLQSFPNSFVFYGTKNSQYQQVGNAVPPLLGQAIAECLLEQLGMYSESSLSYDSESKA
jgi:DNA (cytosine-5)-methyltransferase 1